MTRKFMRWVFRDALLVRDKAIKLLKKENHDLAMEILTLRKAGKA